ncbi:hypothetical protein VNO77_09115 [Canavalia gladiata]|uniref:Uncharacterized protein n=1 Tax=Canavalia gladiata TaxID=3824 RepID=A0AAN9JD15_CANGL
MNSTHALILCLLISRFFKTLLLEMKMFSSVTGDFSAVVGETEKRMVLSEDVHNYVSYHNLDWEEHGTYSSTSILKMPSCMAHVKEPLKVIAGYSVGIEEHDARGLDVLEQKLRDELFWMI